MQHVQHVLIVSASGEGAGQCIRHAMTSHVPTCAMLNLSPVVATPKHVFEALSGLAINNTVLGNSGKCRMK